MKKNTFQFDCCDSSQQCFCHMQQMRPNRISFSWWCPWIGPTTWKGIPGAVAVLNFSEIKLVVIFRFRSAEWFFDGCYPTIIAFKFVPAPNLQRCWTVSSATCEVAVLFQVPLWTYLCFQKILLEESASCTLRHYVYSIVNKRRTPILAHPLCTGNVLLCREMQSLP
jgi:hypothetical protein